MKNLQKPGIHTFIAFSAVSLAFFNRSILSDVVLCLTGSRDAQCVHIINRLSDYVCKLSIKYPVNGPYLQNMKQLQQ